MKTRKFRHVERFRDGTEYIEFSEDGAKYRCVPVEDRDGGWRLTGNNYFSYSLEWALKAVESGAWEEID